MVSINLVTKLNMQNILLKNKIMIPSFFHAQSAAFSEILKLSESNPNDMDFGRKTRAIINEYKTPKVSPHYNIDTPIIDNTNIDVEGNDGNLGSDEG